MSGLPPIVPLDAMLGFSLSADVREVASYYGVRTRDVKGRQGDGRKRELVAMARHALFHRLTVRRGFTPARAAALLGCDKETVREGAEKHAQRIVEFNTTTAAEPEDA